MVSPFLLLVCKFRPLSSLRLGLVYYRGLKGSDFSLDVVFQALSLAMNTTAIDHFVSTTKRQIKRLNAVRILLNQILHKLRVCSDYCPGFKTALGKQVFVDTTRDNCKGFIVMQARIDNCLRCLVSMHSDDC